MNRSFLAGLASGYVSIAVQCIAGLLLVPFLLSRHGVGLEGYGIIATLQAVAALISVVFDGHRQESSRRLALWTAVSDRDSVAGLLLFTLLTTAALAGCFALLATPLSRWLGLAADQYVLALQLALACIVLEQFCYQLDCSLHAAGRSWIASALGAADVALRSILVVTFFTVLGAQVDLFFAAALTGLGIRTLLLWIACRDGIGSVRRPIAKGLQQEAAQFVHSLPLALNGIAPYMVFRLSIIAGNKQLGAEHAGVLAIILVTLRSYLNQVIFSALRPMLVARLAVSGLQEINGRARQRFIDYVTVYQALVYAAAIGAVCSTPLWLPLWLGESLRPFVPYFMAAVGAYFLEIAYGIPYYALVACNHARVLATVNGVVAAVIGGALFGASRLGLPMSAYVGAVIAYLALYALFVRRDFRRLLHFDTRPLDTELALTTTVASVGGWMLSRAAMNAVEVLGIAVIAVAAFLAACHLSVMPMNRAARLIWPRAA